MLNSLMLSSASFGYPLEIVTGATVAFALKRLRPSYSGPAIRVRRSSDNAEQDIGFTGNILDTSALLAFVGAGNGFAKTIYDQSGNGFHATQASNSFQIPIVASGSLYLSGSKNRPVLNLDGNGYLETSVNLGITGNPAWSFSTVTSIEQTTPAVRMQASYGVSAGATWIGFPSDDASSVQHISHISNGFVHSAYLTNTSPTTLKSYAWAHTAGATGVGTSGEAGYMNGVSQALTSLGTGAINLSNGKFRLNGWVGGTGNEGIGKMGELIWWPKTISSTEAAAIYQSQQSYYGL